MEARLTRPPITYDCPNLLGPVVSDCFHVPILAVAYSAYHGEWCKPGEEAIHQGGRGGESSRILSAEKKGLTDCIESSIEWQQTTTTMCYRLMRVRAAPFQLEQVAAGRR